MTIEGPTFDQIQKWMDDHKDFCTRMWDKASKESTDATAYAYTTTRPVVQETIPTSDALKELVEKMREVPAVQTGAYFLPEPAFSAVMGQIQREPISFDLPDPVSPYKYLSLFDYGVKVYRMPSVLLTNIDTGSPVVDDCEEKPRPVLQERPAPATPLHSRRCGPAPLWRTGPPIGPASPAQRSGACRRTWAEEGRPRPRVPSRPLAPRRARSPLRGWGPLAG